MKHFVAMTIYYFMKILMWFRYKVTVKGLENLDSATLSKPGGVLFLPNHPTVFADPVLITLAIHKKYPIRPMIVEYMYYMPIVNWVMRVMDALPVPNFVGSSNSLKKKKADQVFESVIQGLNDGENFLIYPGGKVKNSALEIVSGSGLPYIIQSTPKANIVLVRIKGLWGSSFSRALTGKNPYMFSTILEGIKRSFKNFIFFNPRREITIELVPAGADFPYQGTRLEINRYLEDWYNKPDGLSPSATQEPGDTLTLVPYSIWDNTLPTIYKPPSEEHSFNLKLIPLAIQENVKKKLSEITEIPVDKIFPEQSISADLGLDSLDAAELTAFLDDEYGVTGVQLKDITNVGKVMTLAAGHLKLSQEPDEEESVNLSKWHRKSPSKPIMIPEGETLPEVFLNSCKRMGSDSACGDSQSGVLTYNQLKMRVILLAEQIKKLPGENIGILLPASSAAFTTILAVQLAGKTPVMINWTIGPRHLDSVKELSNIQTILSSWAFLDRLENIQFNGLEEMMLLLEDFRYKISIFDKVKALFRSKLSTKSILKHFNFDKKSADPAVLLFTSGTESMPKGVPLSHENILSNLRPLIEAIDFDSKDALLGILPPFHSFGFTISGLLPLISGCRVAFYPNPTAGAGVAKALCEWEATIVCGAPTFLKNMMKSAKPGQLKTLRMLVSGAEQIPPDLRELARQCQAHLIEGYGITECSPVLTVNASGDPLKGVGKPLDNIQLQVVDLSSYQSLKSGEHGLVLAKGPNIFHGYLNKEVNSPFITTDNGTWYSTGDLGFFDTDGNLILSGRLKRFVKIGGEMVSLSAIETALHESLSVKIKNEAPENSPPLAICAKEVAGEKTRIYLFTSFELATDEANKALRDSGFSNLIRIFQVTLVSVIPLMGTGKVNYRELETKIPETKN
jgi:long-chain-fatty-acid--[acyl-carrier-protein] ligase